MSGKGSNARLLNMVLYRTNYDLIFGEKTNADCFECGDTAVSLHHIIPRSKGGTRTVPLCGMCHAKAHHRDGNMDTATLTKSALYAKRTRGERAGRIPYGYQLADATSSTVRSKRGNPIALEEIPTQTAIVKRIKEERASGATLRSIAAQLTAEGVPTASGNTVWCHTTIVGILKGFVS